MNWIKIATRKQSLIEALAKIRGWDTELFKEIGCRRIRLFFESKQGAITFYFEKNDLDRLNNRLDNILHNEKLESILRDNGIKHFENMVDYTKTLANIGFSNKTDKELFDYYATFVKLQLKVAPFIVLPTFVDEIITPQIENILSKRKLTKVEIRDSFRILASMKEESYASQEEKEFLRIVFRSKGDIKELINKHAKKYPWLGIQAEEPTWTPEYFNKLLRKVESDKKLYEKRLEFLENYSSEILKKKQKVLDRIKPNKEEMKLVGVLEDWVYLKDFRREMLSRYRFYTRGLFEEIGKRLEMSGADVRNLLFEEVKRGLEDKVIKKEIIHKRRNYYVLTNYKERIELLVGDRASRLAHKELIEQQAKTIKQLRGYGVSPGNVKGIVKLILGTSDMNKLNKGDILVAIMTTPDIVPVMKRAAAVITDEGGLLCHAAIISRELKIPCIVGTKIATQVLKDGDKVEVDANKGIMRKL